MLIAGATAAGSQALGIDTAAASNPTLIDRAKGAALRAASSTAVNSTIGGMKLKDAALSAIRTGAADAVGGHLASVLGQEYKAPESDIDYITHKILHTAIGAGIGAVSDGDALAGAIGSCVAEITGEAFAEHNEEELYDPELRDKTIERGVLLSKLAAITAAGIFDQDPNTAARTAENAVRENAFLIPPAIMLGEAVMAAFTAWRAARIAKGITEISALSYAAYKASQVICNEDQHITTLEESARMPADDELLHPHQESIPIHDESGPKILSTPIEAETGPKINSTPIHENDRVDEGYDIYDGPSSSTFTTLIPDDINKPNILAKDGEIDLKRNPSHNERDFDRKARALQDLADRGKLRVNRDYKRNSEQTELYRENIKRRLMDKYKNDQDKYNSVISKINNMDVDHLSELQLNGEDIIQNMWLLDKGVNRSIGRQIRHQTKNMQHGDKISKINIKE